MIHHRNFYILKHRDCENIFWWQSDFPLWAHTFLRGNLEESSFSPIVLSYFPYDSEREWWKLYVHVLLFSNAMETLLFGRNGPFQNAFPFFWRTDDFCFVEWHSFYTTIQEKILRNISKRKIYINSIISMICLYGISVSIWLVLHGCWFGD